MTEGTDRVCAFSDGVFAIACTLLILEIRLPHGEGDGSLWPRLVALWPSYLAFALSFFVILVSWITHHDLMKLVRATDRPARFANGLALLYVTFIPFPTAVLAQHLGGPQLSQAVAFYCGTFVFGSAAFNLLVAQLTRADLFLPGTEEAVGKFRRGYRLTFAIYLSATLIALVAPWLALAINVAVRLHLLRIAHQTAPHVHGREGQLTS